MSRRESAVAEFGLDHGANRASGCSGPGVARALVQAGIPVQGAEAPGRYLDRNSDAPPGQYCYVARTHAAYRHGPWRLIQNELWVIESRPDALLTSNYDGYAVGLSSNCDSYDGCQAAGVRGVRSS